MYQGNQVKDNLDTFFLYRYNLKYLIDINTMRCNILDLNIIFVKTYLLLLERSSRKMCYICAVHANRVYRHILESVFLLYSDCVKLDTLQVIDGIMWRNALLVCICIYRNTFQAESHSAYSFITGSPTLRSWINTNVGSAFFLCLHCFFFLLKAPQSHRCRRVLLWMKKLRLWH